MALKTEVNIKVRGDFIKGTVIGERFFSQEIAKINGQFFNLADLKVIAEELRELIETVEGTSIANKLESDTPAVFNPNKKRDDEWDV